jgi:hypothetical protein
LAATIGVIAFFQTRGSRARDETGTLRATLIHAQSRISIDVVNDPADVPAASIAFLRAISAAIAGNVLTKPDAQEMLRVEADDVRPSCAVCAREITQVRLTL